ncbi:hypothetical protein Hokovirus_1_130 [Hokovirus HKV1]|uniref:Uncharacterized protein n=1 Tax=Hokovirus HKV1 TaxID=1977638 RepID=A0A1V0SEZ9_9VIRU|nr:hypothetical protein Hokovirus_1_130 [Hokovirus HKV1]
MSILFYDKIDNTLCKFKKNKHNTSLHDKDIINYGDPIVFEYKKINIRSKYFNMIGSTNIMITNNIKTIQTKEITQDSITYYDKNVYPKGSFTDKYRTYSINTFDPSEYGNSICYYTPGYNLGTIIMATKFWKIVDDNIIDMIGNLIKFITSNTPQLVPYITLIDGVVDNTTSILSLINDNKPLIDTHIIEFNQDNLVAGIYICLPLLSVKELQDFINDWYLDTNSYTIIKKNDENLTEYDDTYFILEVSKNNRNDLLDFDFSASSNELLDKLHKNIDVSIKDFIQIAKNANDTDYIKQIIELMNNTIDKAKIKYLYNHLSKNNQSWISQMYPDIVTYI